MRKCPICKKRFIPAPNHIYRINTKGLVCSWGCVRKHEREKEKRKNDSKQST